MSTNKFTISPIVFSERALLVIDKAYNRDNESKENITTYIQNNVIVLYLN